jgi:hypothetical protein
MGDEKRRDDMGVHVSWTDEQRTSGEQTAGAWEAFFAEAAEAPLAGVQAIGEIGRATEAKDRLEPELLEKENVVGVATSLKVVGGTPTQQPSVTVLVERKLPLDELPEEARVPEEVDGVPTDVLEVGRIVPLTFNARVRPVTPGYSIGHPNITAGTFGCLVRDIRRCCCKLEKDCGCCTPTSQECPGDYLILSNNHVLADTNQAELGDLILQPGPFDGGVFPADCVATLERFEPIVFGRSGYNLVDAAVARPTFGRNVTPSIIGILVPRGVDQVFVGTGVVKVGRTTQITEGRVLAVDATVLVAYGAGIAQFRQQIITTAMSAGGDSGSLLLDTPNGNAVGLLFAGSPEITIHNHIADVENALGVRPVTAPRSS